MKSETIPAKLNLSTGQLKLPEAVPAVPARDLALPAHGLPWVIEVRVVGTTSTLQKQVRGEMLLGRTDFGSINPEIDLTPYRGFENGVSRKHALILIKDNRLMLRDLNSTNGTRLNNALCNPGQEYPLQHGDELMLGRLRLQLLFSVVPASDTRAPAQVENSPASVFGNNRRVLIIEDDAAVGEVLRMALEQSKFRVTEVHTIAAGMGELSQALPDVLILNPMIGDLNGLDLVRFVRKQDPRHRVPVLIISGATAGYQMSQALEAGADLFLGKPLAIEALLRAVQASLQPTSEEPPKPAVEVKPPAADKLGSETMSVSTIKDDKPDDKPKPAAPDQPTGSSPKA